MTNDNVHTCEYFAIHFSTWGVVDSSLGSIKLHFCSEPITTTTPASPASCHLDPPFSQKPEKGKKKDLRGSI